MAVGFFFIKAAQYILSISPDEQQGQPGEQGASEEQVAEVETSRNEKPDSENQVPEMKNRSEHFRKNNSGTFTKNYDFRLQDKKLRLSRI